MTLRARTIGLLAAAAALTLVGCGDDEEEPSATRAATETAAAAAPSEEPEDVLAGVIERDLADPAYRAGGFRADPAISAALVAQIDRLEAEARRSGLPGIDVDPFLCAQNTPTHVTYGAASAAGDRVTIVGRLHFGKTVEKVTYVLLLADGGWRLDSTECVDAAQPRGE